MNPTEKVEAVPIVESALVNIVGSDPEFRNKMLSKYILNADNIMKKIHISYNALDYQTIAFSAHKLKSSTYAIGAISLGKVCSDLERFSIKNDESEVSRLIMDLDSSFARVNEYIKVLLSSSKG